MHGDDFVFAGTDADLDYALEILKANYEIKNRGRLRGDEGDVQEIDLLGRVIKYHDWGLSWRADARHRKMILEHFGFDKGTQSLSKNGYNEEDKDEGESEEHQLAEEEETCFRALAARANYLAQDNPFIQFPTKEICRSMAKPREKDFDKLKKLARFLVGASEAEYMFEWQSEERPTT